MQSMMRSLLLAPAMLAGAALATNSALATTLNVPFSFTANGKVCPAGRYEINEDMQRSVVTLRNPAHAFSFAWLTSPGDPAPTATTVLMQFDRSDQGYQLRRVQYGPMVTSQLDKKSKHAEHAPIETIQGQ
jgi:hypothetical protein